MSYPFKYFRQMSYEDAAYTVKGYLEEIGKYQ